MAANAAATLEGIYGQAKAAREAAAQSSRDQQLQSLATTYGRGIERVNTAADEAQRQNYITNQMQQRNLGQQLAAVGLNGGAAESTVLALNNQYGANRRQTEADRMGQIGDLQAEWAAQRAAAESQYNDQMAGIAADWASQLAAAKQAQIAAQKKALEDTYVPPANVVYPYSDKEQAKKEGKKQVMNTMLPTMYGIISGNYNQQKFTNLSTMTLDQLEKAFANGQITEDQLDKELKNRGY